MPPTNVRDPSYFHKVVDCQWACPAHTNVPEYIRLIAQGRYTDAYLLNRESNVFPGILGRTCDRPCEPACRRGRVEPPPVSPGETPEPSGQPVAICRLKRVAADNRDDEVVRARLPVAPAKKNGKRVACIGAGPASLTVANDLLPLGYEVTIFERLPVPGGLMRSNIPAFRLPEAVLNEEIDMIVGMGAIMKYNTPIESLRSLLEDGGFDAVFVGTGAPKGKNLEIPGRYDSDKIYIGIDWLHGVAFGHVTEIEEHVLIIGVGNTAMDCCRTSRRLGGKDVKVMARRPRPYFKASPWELDDATEEQVEIIVNHAPKAFVIEQGVLKGMTFDRLTWEPDEKGQLTKSKVIDTVFIAAGAVILAIGQEGAFPWIERDIGLEFDKWGMPKVDKKTFQSTRAGVFFGGDAAWGPENIIWAVEHGHQAAISIDNHCHGVPLDRRPAQGMTLTSTKMGLHQWSYKNDYDPAHRQKMTHVDLVERFKSINVEVETGFTAEQTAREAARCLNCDVQTVFTDRLCIECDACVDVCPLHCLTITRDGDDLRARLSAPALNPKQDIFASGPLPQTGRLMVKDEDVCVHCSLCAERCPTAAWDMQRFDLSIFRAGHDDYDGGAPAPQPSRETKPCSTT